MADYIEIDRYTAVKLEDGGQYGIKIMEGNVDQAGEFWPAFCMRRFGKNAPEKKTPVCVKLGDRDKAIAVLKTLLLQLDVPF